MVQALGSGDPGAVGKYRLVGRLGRGGMGQVYLGESPGGRLVAVKLIRAELAGDPDFRARFAREVATARTVSGIYTVPVVDADVDGAQPWLVTAYVEGPSLADAVRDFGPFAPGQVLTLAAGLAEGLEVIHASGVVHRDLKPSNVLLAQDGPRIIDFGISRAGDLPGVTRTGLVTGSPGYMSPEQAEGGVAGPASDVFSLGSVLAFAVTGREPFGSGSGPSVLYRVVHSQPDVDGIPEPLRSLVARCLAKDPALRPAAGEVVAELSSARPGTNPGNARVPGAPSPGLRAPYQPTVTSVRADSGGQVDLAGLGLGGGPGTWPAQAAGPPTLRQQGPTRGRRSNGLAWATAAVAVIVVAGAVIAVAVSHRSAQANAGPGTGALVSASPSALSASDSVTAGWVRYANPSGFSVEVPPGWSVTSSGTDEVRFTGPTPGDVILIAWTSQPKADALTDWEQQAAAKAQTDPTYEQVSLQRVDYRGWNTADWEFINSYDGEPTQVLDRGFVVTPGVLGYAIEIYGPVNGFAAARAALWDGLTTTFQPAS
jgi:eukaryotic-like serine/threonine-protein kinase